MTATPVYYVDPPHLILGAGVRGGYVRHRDRMVQESVYRDLRDSLIALGWLAGTTERPVYDSAGNWGTVTLAPGQEMPLLEEKPIVLIDYFPDAEQSDAAGMSTQNRTAVNTFALDSGERLEPGLLEMGGTAEVVPYNFLMAFYANSDATAQALLNDLADRYRGRIARPDFIDLWDYNANEALPVTRMSVESFTYAVNTDRQLAPHEVHLYFAELSIEDEVDAQAPNQTPVEAGTGFGEGLFGETPFGG